MKKVLTACLVALLALSLCATAFAAPKGFVSSPSGNPAPTQISFANQNAACTARLVITAYADRKTLPDTLLTQVETAYSEITSASSLTALNADLAKIATDNQIDPAKLAVSDLFDLRIEGCTAHEGHVGHDVTLKADTLNRFVALLHRNQNGAWELVSNAKVEHNGEYLTFSVDTFSPFAIVVNTAAGGEDSPATGINNRTVYICGGVMVVSALGLCAVLVKSKKEKSI